MKEKVFFSREEMFKLNVESLENRGVGIIDIAEIAYRQQSRYNPNITMDTCIQSVEKILSLRDIFHIVQLGIEIDRLAEEGKLSSPIQEILKADLGMFGVDEILGLAIASNYGVIGQTNFGDIDVNKPGIVKTLNDEGSKPNICHTFLDDIVGAIAAAASTRVAQIVSENEANKPN
jgi:phosphatidylglycerophosphatase A